MSLSVYKVGSDSSISSDETAPAVDNLTYCSISATLGGGRRTSDGWKSTGFVLTIISSITTPAPTTISAPTITPARTDEDVLQHG